MKNGYVKRKLEDTILKYLKTPEIIAVVGPRQSGKTTMLRRLYESLQRAVFSFLPSTRLILKNFCLFGTGSILTCIRN